MVNEDQHDITDITDTDEHGKQVDHNVIALTESEEPIYVNIMNDIEIVKIH